MQTWKTETLPDKWLPSQDAINRHMKDWKYVLMTDQDNREFVKKHFPDYIELYDSFKFPIQRADMIRYCWLYINGGIYIDCDIEILGDISHLLPSSDTSKCFLVKSGNMDKVFTNALMASYPKCELWIKMLEYMKQYYQSTYQITSIDRHLEIMYSTGPMALTAVAKKNMNIVIPLPSDILNPYNICEQCYDKEKSLVKPLEGSSWVTPIGKFYQSCYCNRHSLIAIAIIVVLLIIAYFLF